MHLAIDAREALNEKPTGKGFWARGFLTELQKRQVKLTLLTNDLGSGIGWHFAAARYLRQHKDITAYISPTSFIVPALLGRNVPTLCIIHDLIAFRPEPHEHRATWIERLTLPRVVRHAHHLFTISDTTKCDLLERFPACDPSRITSIFAGPATEGPPWQDRGTQTILCIGTLCPRKNQERLIDAFAMLPPELRRQSKLLLIGGRGWQDDGIVRKAKRTENVEWFGYLGAGERETLMQSCTALAIPSLYEGFGMSLLEAMQRGIPVLASDRGSLMEIAGDAALTVDPENMTQMCDALARVLTDGNLRAELSAKGILRARQFSWQRTVDLFLEALQDSPPPPRHE